jgi:DNA-binding PadR family transcriptional regulator
MKEGRGEEAVYKLTDAGRASLAQLNEKDAELDPAVETPEVAEGEGV